MLHSTELRSTLRANLLPSELSCTLLSYDEPYLSYAAPQELRCSLWISWALLSYTTTFELRCILLSYAAHY
jgi:hypothetical protein